jgi:diguanylate cyclase (GGDEF)-like protein
MIIDIQTLLIASGIVVAVSGVSFILSTALRRSEAYGRTWSIAFVAGILETIAYIVWAASPEAWWGVGVGNASLALAIALMWSGCRQFNERRSLFWIALLGAGAVGAASVIQGPNGGAWAGAAAMFAAIVVFAALAGLETVSGNLRRALDARVLTIVFFVVAVYYLLRLAVFLTAGESSEIFTTYFGTVTTTVIAIVLVIVAAISMTAIQPATERGMVRAGGSTRSLRIEGVSDLEHFEQEMLDWLVRSRRERETLVLLALSVDGLGHINSAFGRSFGDQTIRTVGRIACEFSPAAALIAHSGGGRFLILTTAPAIGSPVAIAERLQTALVETPVDAVQGIRAIATFGLASTDDVGYGLTEMALAADSALQVAKATGPGTITLAETLEVAHDSPH